MCQGYRKFFHPVSLAVFYVSSFGYQELTFLLVFSWGQFKTMAKQKFHCHVYLIKNEKSKNLATVAKTICQVSIKLMVGMRRFELPTPRPPDEYSNRTELHPELNSIFLKMAVQIYSIPRALTTLLLKNQGGNLYTYLP